VEACVAGADLSQEIVEQARARNAGAMLIPTPDQIELAMYGNDVMDLTSSGLRSI
jgi:hypothetical protein